MSDEGDVNEDRVIEEGLKKNLWTFNYAKNFWKMPQKHQKPNSFGEIHAILFTMNHSSWDLMISYSIYHKIGWEYITKVMSPIK